MTITKEEKMMDELLKKLDMLNDLEQVTRELVLEHLIKQVDLSIDGAMSCESPIEFEMSFRLKRYIKIFNAVYNTDFEILNQANIILPHVQYRVDMLIYPSGKKGHMDTPQIIVECDGHEFHEKTKEQAARDKKRDRDLQITGFRVLHFTGSEIYRNPEKCAAEVMRFLETLI